MVVEQTLVDGDTQMRDMYHLGGGNVHLVDLNFALALSLHGPFVENFLGWLIDTKDHDLVDDLSGGFGVEVLVTNGSCNADLCSIVFVADLGLLVVSIVVVLTVIEIQVTAGLRVHAHGVGVDLKADWVLNSLEERLSRLLEVKDGKDRATTDPCALFGIADVLDEDVVVGGDLKLGVDIVPLGSGWQINLDLGCATGDGILHRWSANLGGDKDVWAEHELVAQVESLAILRELHPHRAHDGETSLSGLVEQVVHVVRLSVSLLNSSEDGPLDAGRLQPRLTHLVADLGVGAEEWEVNTELVELNE